MKKISILTLLSLLALSTLTTIPHLVKAEEATDLTEVSASEAGATATQAATATSEITKIQTITGTLIEIGNTTAEETTIIVRAASNGITADKTVQITAATKIINHSGLSSGLSEWIAGDQIVLIVSQDTNSGELKALKIKNLSLKNRQKGLNGWIKAIRADKNEMDVEWSGQVYTLNTTNAKMVAGLKNPATLTDFQINDRVRARVAEDGDTNRLTWRAEIIVVLRRDQALFMRVTRWVVPAEITSVPDNTSTLPYLITAKVLESKFYEKGDVNNLIGAPGTEIKIQVDQNTNLVRRFLGRSKINEFMESDQIRVVGRLNEITGNLDAAMIKNESIQALGVAQTLSEVISADTTNNKLVVKLIGAKNPLTGKRHRLGNTNQWTVTLQTGAKIIKNGTNITLAEIAPGDFIRVRGVANRVQKTMTVNAVSVVTNKFKNLIE